LTVAGLVQTSAGDRFEPPRASYSQEADVDLRISVQNEECVLSGQIIREGCQEGLVEISGASGSAAAALNELCEFALPPIPIGNYSLKVKMPDVEIEIPLLELKD
jgi:hypothetical protein